jgi:hypothetical protein
MFRLAARLAALAVVCLAGIAEAAPQSPDSSAVPEYSAKAGFLTTFTKYTSWPAGAFESATAPVVIGVIGRDPFGDVLDKAAARQGGRPLEVRRLRSQQEAERCHVVFIGKAASRSEAEWLAALSSRPILTVAESGEPAARGSIVQFVLVGNRLTFDVNLSAAEQAGIRLSSDLLSHARQVVR